MNYGTLVIMDGSPEPPPPRPEVPSNRFVRMGPGSNGALAPPPPALKSPSASFVVELNYSDRVYLYGGAKKSILTEVSVSRMKSVTRLAPGDNPLKAATDFISKFAGCPEARKVRGRAIALSRIRRTISGETFRFPLEAP